MRYFLLTATVVLTLALAAGAAAPAAADPGECDDLRNYTSVGEYRECLVDHTSKADVLTYVERDRANLTQKQVDSVYAVYPSHADEYGFTIGEEREITAWMMEWANVSIPEANVSVPRLNTTLPDANVSVNPPNVTLPNPSQPTPTPTPTPTSETVDDAPDRPNGTTVDDHTTLVRTNYHDERETVTVVLHSETRQVITVNDAGALVAGGSGQIPRRVDAVEPGETIRVTLPVTRHEGYVGVAISTDNALYGHTIAAESDAFERISKTTPQKALLIGVVVALSWVVIAGVSELRREGGEPVVAS
ncbi:hypothetical protein HZS55_09805 [Halosimplex rubrum]|uniref:Uncharacterized protein n=1 Tax=Halosimplex rubrum TaxID=869889 RepID=A0A7D5T5G8_9EURY|nr:hypothetical protein HZS55_09805 [Halosimplex rubrum]